MGSIIVYATIKHNFSMIFLSLKVNGLFWLREDTYSSVFIIFCRSTCKMILVPGAKVTWMEDRERFSISIN